MPFHHSQDRRNGRMLQRWLRAMLVALGAMLPAIASFLLKPKELAPGEEPVFKPRH